MRITSPDALASPGTRWQTFIKRIGRLREVDAVEIDRRRGTAVLCYSPQAARLEQILERMSVALAAPDTEAASATLSNFFESLSHRSHIRLFRRGEHLSTWEILHDAPGRLRVRDVELCKSPAAVQRIGTELGTQPGIRNVTISALTGSVLVRYDAAVVDRETILARLDDLVREGGMIACQALPGAAQWLFANATLGLAAAGVLLYPPLLPISAVLLVASNIPTFQQAWQQIRRRHAGLPVLHSAIVGATLASGGFLSAGLMNWLLLFWEDRRARLTAAGHQMLSDSVRLPQARVWVVRDGAELETPLAQLQPGDVVAVRAGEPIPVDGQIVLGTAVIDEKSVHGTTGLVFRGTGDGVYQGSWLVSGELRVEVHRTENATVAATIDRLLTASAKRTSIGSASSVPQFAEQAVPPVLLTAGVGLLLGGPTLAAAVLRPDYASGPGLGDSLALIDELASCLDQGIIIRRPNVFQQMASADVVVFDHDRLLESRLLQIASVCVAAGFSTDEILGYAACATRQFHDPRAQAVCLAYAELGRAPLNLPVTYRSGTVEFADGNRMIRITGLESGRDQPQPLPLFVFSNGELAGSLVFREGTACAAGDAIRDLRVRCGMQIELVSSAPAAQVEELANALGVDDVHLCPTDEAQETVILNLVARGHSVVYVGDCRKNPRAAKAAQLAVFPSPDPTWEADPSGVWLPAANYERLAALRDAAVSIRDQARSHCNLILIPNMVCIAGAFLFGFTSLAVVILSNLGTYSVYSQSRVAMRRTERRLLNRRQRLPSERQGPPADNAQSRLILQGTH